MSKRKILLSVASGFLGVVIIVAITARVTAARLAQTEKSGHAPAQMIKPAVNGTYPKAFSHIGLSVPDLDKAFKFYTEVMGWYVIMPPTEIKRDDSAIGVMCTDVFGKDWTKFRIAHLATSDKVGVEMFEFPNSEPHSKQFEYWKTSIFHFCVQDPDVEGLAKKIVEHGGKQRMPVRYYYPGEKPYRMVYCEDPFGNIIEIYSHSYELTYSSGAYAGEYGKEQSGSKN